MSITAATAHAACTTALDIGADAILTVSQRGTAAQMIGRFRTSTTVVALPLDPQVQRQMNLYWDAESIMMPCAASGRMCVCRSDGRMNAKRMPAPSFRFFRRLFLPPGRVF